MLADVGLRAANGTQTAAAVVVGSSVLDPIFQGLAVPMMAGEVAAALLSRTAVPVLYYLLKRSEEKRAAADADASSSDRLLGHLSDDVVSAAPRRPGVGNEAVRHRQGNKAQSSAWDGTEH